MILRYIYTLIFLLFTLTSIAPSPRSVSEVYSEINLEKGVKYKELKILSSKRYHTAHIIELDLKNSSFQPDIYFAKSKAGETDIIHDIIAYNDSVSGYTSVAGINASFWRAYSLFPIGPTVVNGEIVEMRRHKFWTSMIIDQHNDIFIDTLEITGIFIDRFRRAFNIERVNRRLDSLGIVFYNHFIGKQVPYIYKTTINEAVKDADLDKEFSDSTELEFEKEKLIREIKQAEILSHKEFRMMKILVEYIDEPTINKEFRCRVIRRDTGLVEMPVNCGIISFGDDTPADIVPNIGDIIKLSFSTNIMYDRQIKSILTATPRIVRNGKANHEARQEGNTGRRFMNKRLPRSAIGLNKTRDKLLLVSIEPGKRNRKTNGATLTELAIIMKKLGCYNAFNLDGGGSASMWIDGKNVMSSNPERSRKIASMIVIRKK